GHRLMRPGGRRVVLRDRPEGGGGQQRARYYGGDDNQHAGNQSSLRGVFHRARLHESHIRIVTYESAASFSALHPGEGDPLYEGALREKEEHEHGERDHRGGGHEQSPLAVVPAE